MRMGRTDDYSHSAASAHSLRTGRLRDECPNTHWFLSWDDARSKIEAWRTDFNDTRPHTSLGFMTIAEFASSAGVKPRPMKHRALLLAFGKTGVGSSGRRSSASISHRTRLPDRGTSRFAYRRYSARHLTRALPPSSSKTARPQY
ncbi:integrase core domain-containing protein [Sphingobium ummariense]|uniref:integrase core domain-containing protein n=1 Tax=Sphingobium ummariense TaxID=420994 RepID=UPI0038B527EA